MGAPVTTALVTSEDDFLPTPAIAPRPVRPLSGLQLVRVGLENTLAACDEELFEKLIVKRRYFGRPVFVISDPEGVKRVLLDNAANYPRLPHVRRSMEAGLKTGLFTGDAETWTRHRRIMNPAFETRALRADMPRMIAMMAETVEQLAACAPKEPIDIAPFLLQWLGRTSAYVCADDVEAMQRVILGMAKYPGPHRFLDFLVMPQWLRARLGRGRIANEAESYYPTLARLIAERRNAAYTGRQDLIWRLINARERETGAGMSDEEVRDEILNMAVASPYASLRALTWIWYLLALHPWAEAKLHAEIDAVMGRNRPSYDDIQKLGFLRNVLNETMRLYPPNPMMLRAVRGADVVCGTRIPRWSIVIVSQWVIHRHQALWADPDRFDPERFSPEQVAGRPRFAYLPFSFGPRVCIGMALATMQMQTAVAMLAQRFRFRLVPGRAVEPTAWTTLRAKGGLPFIVEPRER